MVCLSMKSFKLSIQEVFVLFRSAGIKRHMHIEQRIANIRRDKRYGNPGRAFIQATRINGNFNFHTLAGFNSAREARQLYCLRARYHTIYFQRPFPGIAHLDFRGDRL